MTLRSLLNKGFLHLLSVNFLAQFLSFGSLLLVARFLTPAEFGEVKVLQSYAAVLSVLAGFGFGSAVLKTCSENREAAEKAYLLRYALASALLTTTLTLGLLAALSLSGVMPPSQRSISWLLIYACGVVPFAALTEILITFLQALKKIKAMAQAQAVMKVQFFFLVVFFAWAYGFKGFIFSTVAASALGLLFLWHRVRPLSRGAAPVPLPPNFFGIAIFSVIGNGLVVVGQYIDIFVLDHLVGDRAEIGYYSLATIFFLGALQVTATVQAVTAPYFSERSHDEAWLRRQLVLNQKRTAALSVAVAVATYLAALLLVPALYGPAYRPSLFYLAILMLKYVLVSSYAIIGVALLGLGMVRYNVVVVAITLPLGAILSYLLLKRFGVAGVAWAQVITALVALPLAILMGRMALNAKFHARAQ